MYAEDDAEEVADADAGDEEEEEQEKVANLRNIHLKFLAETFKIHQDTHKSADTMSQNVTS